MAIALLFLLVIGLMMIGVPISLANSARLNISSTSGAVTLR